MLAKHKRKFLIAPKLKTQMKTIATTLNPKDTAVVAASASVLSGVPLSGGLFNSYYFYYFSVLNSKRSASGY